MAFPTFSPTYRPSAGPSNYHTEPRKLRAQFGDGYDQTVREGINAVRKQVRLVWSTLTIANANALTGFFESASNEVFYYTLPDEGVPRKWEALSWDRDFTGGALGSVSVELRERFDPD